jgi:hypothetical protein
MDARVKPAHDEKDKGPLPYIGSISRIARWGAFASGLLTADLYG